MIVFAIGTLFGFFIATVLWVIVPGRRLPAFALRKLVDFYKGELGKR